MKNNVPVDYTDNIENDISSPKNGWTSDKQRRYYVQRNVKDYIKMLQCYVFDRYVSYNKWITENIHCVHERKRAVDFLQ